MSYKEISHLNDDARCVIGQAAAVVCQNTKFTTAVATDESVHIYLSYLKDQAKLEEKDHIHLIFLQKEAVEAMINSLKLALKHFTGKMDIDTLLDNEGKDGFCLLEVDNM